MPSDLETDACTPVPLRIDGFNSACSLPYGLTTLQLRDAMQEFLSFLGFINAQLSSQEIVRLESLLMPANFSSLVGEFMSSTIPKHCPGLAKNTYHNGHPDLLPAGAYANDSAQHVSEGIEIKASHYSSGWQGHNPEDVWLMVFEFESSRPTDPARGVAPIPFRFVRVLGARLTKEDWSFSGRSGQSRRTITASVTRSGYDKMTANWVYSGDAGERQSSLLDSKASC